MTAGPAAPGEITTTQGALERVRVDFHHRDGLGEPLEGFGIGRDCAIHEWANLRENGAIVDISL
jgi:hypothetical protein